MVELITAGCILSGIIAPLIICGSIRSRRIKIVRKTSNKIRKIQEANNSFNFNNPKSEWTFMYHCSSLKNFRNTTYEEIEKAFFAAFGSEVFKSLKMLEENNNKYNEYIRIVNDICSEETIVDDSVKFKLNIYKKHENEMIHSLLLNPILKMSIRMACEYTSPKGYNHYESQQYFLRYNPANGENISYFTDNYACDTKAEFILPVGGALIPNHSLREGNFSIREKKEKEIARKHDYYVTLHVEVSVLSKFIYYFTYLNRYNMRTFQYSDFAKFANKDLVCKVDKLRNKLDEIYYMEDANQIFERLEEIKQIATEADNFHLMMKSISIDMLEDLKYVLNVCFSCNINGELIIESAQFGLAEDVNLYLESNPNSLLHDCLAWINNTLESINSSSKNKIALLDSQILQKSNDRCRFYFEEHVGIVIDIDINTDKMAVKSIPRYFFDNEEISRNLAKNITMDRSIFFVCDSFLSDVSKINEYYSVRFSTLINKLIGLREQYKDTKKIRFMFSESITASKEWSSYFNLRPNVEPVNLDMLSEGKLICEQSLFSKMREYQKYAFEWANKLVSNSFSGILADDMGLGKTLEIISLLNADKTEMPNLIVCPSSLLHNWEREMNKWCPEEKVVLRRSINTHLFENKTKFMQKITYIVSYDFMVHNCDDLKEIHFNYLILDEAQYIKNESTSRSKHAKMLRANYRFALTGTPLENSSRDLINIFDFVMPYLCKKYNLWALNDSVVKEYVSPFLLRRRKTEVLNELPEKNVIMVELDMPENQKSLYDTFKANNANENDQYIKLLALLTKLRQICVCPQMIFENSDIQSVKIQYMLDLVQEIIQNGENVLVYSFFASVFDYVEQLMKEKNIDYLRIDGNVSPSKRSEIIDEFDNNDKIHCFLISLKAGGVGLNLTKANNVIFLDPWWNIAVENQASDRTHRIGQTKNVTVYRLICKDTIEEKVMNIQKDKLALINFFVESDGDDPLGKLTIDAMKELLI